MCTTSLLFVYTKKQNFKIIGKTVNRECFQQNSGELSLDLFLRSLKTPIPSGFQYYDSLIEFFAQIASYIKYVYLTMHSVHSVVTKWTLSKIKIGLH